MAEKSLPKVNPIDRPFWRGAAAGKLLLQKCKSCGKLQFFPRVACVDCFGGGLDWVASSGAGAVHSFTWVRVPRNPAFKEEAPICYAAIILDEGVMIESRIVGAAEENVKPGGRVRVRFSETADPEIKLPVFELAE